MPIWTELDRMKLVIDVANFLFYFGVTSINYLNKLISLKYMSEKNKPSRSSRPHKSYQHIAFVFIILAVILILGVSYLALSKVTITLTPSDAKISHEFRMTISEEPNMSTSTNSVLAGKIIREQVEASGSSMVESENEIESQAEGEVVVYNDRNVTQNLVATTRLLTTDGVLFRLENRITIPANSSVKAKVYADKKGASGNIGPSTFTIPGLSTDLQSLVYAKSETAMSGGVRKIGVLTESDIERAVADLENKILKERTEETKAELNNMDLIGINSRLTDNNYEPELGQEVDSFEVNIEMEFEAVFANKEDILEMAKYELKNKTESEGQYVNVDPSSLKYELISIGASGKEAEIKIMIEGLASLDPNKDMFDKNLLVGFTEDDLKLYFSQFESIEKIKVEFSPFWVKKVPILKDHIIIEVE